MCNRGVCYIVGAGDTECIYINREGSFVIAADGGFEKLGDIIADIVVGDFDSLGFIPKQIETVVLPVEKDDTDTAYAVSLGIEKGFKTFVIYGGMGGRPDHTLANISLIADLSARGNRGYLIGEGFVTTAVTNGEIKLPVNAGGTVSVFAFSDKCEGVNIEGLKYTLDDYTLKSNRALGVSNAFIGEEALVSVKNGTLIVMWQEDNIKKFVDNFINK